LILLSEKKISSGTALVPLMEQCHHSGHPLIIVAEDVDGEALSTLLLNRLRMNLKVCAIKAPGFGDNRKNALRDMAILTGGQVFSEELGQKMEDIQLSDLGRAGKITVTKEDTVLLNGFGKKEDIDERVSQIRAQLEATESTYEQEKLQERLGKIAGGVAVIRVGGASEVEVNEKKDRMNDALNATKAAIAEGVVPGGGIALLYATQILDGFKVANDDQKVGVNIIKRAMQVPAISIIRNAGKEGAVYAGKMLETATPDSRYGYDAATDTFADLFELGVLDPVKVVRTALKDAASVASLMTTTEAVITDSPRHDKPIPKMDMGGPGGAF
jgi:chaperonin GroEL